MKFYDWKKHNIENHNKSQVKVNAMEWIILNCINRKDELDSRQNLFIQVKLLIRLVYTDCHITYYPSTFLGNNASENFNLKISLKIKF